MSTKSSVKKRLKICDDDFQVINTSQLENLPNEILLKIFDYMKIKDLLRCGQVSRRIRITAHDQSLWQKVNFNPKKIVPTGLLELILENNCEYLSTYGKIVGKLNLDKASQLKCLVASNLIGYSDHHSNDEVLGILLDSCHTLEKLSLNSVTLNSSMIASIYIQNCKTLKVLRLNGCNRLLGLGFLNILSQKEVTLKNIMPIVDYCTELRELDLSHCLISEEAMDYLANNLSLNTTKLSFRGMNRIQDHQVKMLVSKCNNITEFNLCSTEVSDDSVTYIIKHLHSTLEKLDLTHTNTTLNKLFKLKAMNKLTCLNWRKFHGGIEALKKHLPNTHINTQINTHIGELSIGPKIVVANCWKETLLTFRTYELMSDSSEFEVSKRKDLKY
jgi:hypothetical protein